MPTLTSLSLGTTEPRYQKRTTNVYPVAYAATVFREKWKDVVKRADGIQGQVAAMENACGKETAVQVSHKLHPGLALGHLASSAHSSCYGLLLLIMHSL